MADFTISTLRGGVNLTDPATALAPDQCVQMDNVELHTSTLGEKRFGCLPIDLGTIDPDVDEAPFVFRYLPVADQTLAELWTLLQERGGTTHQLRRKTDTWSTVSEVTVSVDDAIDVSGALGFALQAASFNQKMFLCYKSVGGTDRLHCWDGSTLRRVGLAEPAVPTVADEGSGAFAGKRYYRVRYTVVDGATVERRSEPSDNVTFTPSGSGAGARLTKPAAIGEGETNWEIEASLNNVDFYRVASVVVGTTTYDDTVAYAVGYMASGVLSEDLGDYEVPGAAEFITIDQDRVILGSNFEDDSMTSTVSWTPVTGDPGVGNDERIPVDSNNFLNLDSTDGGALTGLSRAVNGRFFVFKYGGVYMFTRTGTRANAYQQDCLTKEKGAIKNSIVNGVDAQGRPCVYFTDPVVGPCQIDFEGTIRIASWDVYTLWKTINLSAVQVVTGVFFPDSRQLRYWFATGASDYPNQAIVAHVNYMREDEQGLRRGWVTWSEGRQTEALSVCLYADNIDDNAPRSLTLVPFIGVGGGSGGDGDYLQRCNVGATDDGDVYHGVITTRPYAVGNLLDKFGINCAVMVAPATLGTNVEARIVLDFKADDAGYVKTVAVDLTPEGTEPYVIRYLDNLSLSDGRVVQFAFGDLTVTQGLWAIDQFSVRDNPQDQA